MIKYFRIELILLSIILISIFFSRSADLFFVNFLQNISQYLGAENCKYCSSNYLKKFFIGITELGDSLWYFIISVLSVASCLIINKTKTLPGTELYDIVHSNEYYEDKLSYDENTIVTNEFTPAVINA